MADSEYQRGRTDAKVHDLMAAINRVRNAQAERDDAIDERREAARARLELLAQDLRPVFQAVPPDNDQFDFALSDGATPRLWIDMTSFVRMGRNGMVYEFVKDTRLGRIVLAETDNRNLIGRQITDYVAERIIERERAVEGDWISMKPAELHLPGRTADAEPDGRTGARWRWSTLLAILAFLVGMVAGALLLAARLQMIVWPVLDIGAVVN